MSPGDDFSLRAVNEKRGLAPSPVTVKNPTTTNLEALPAVTKIEPPPASPLTKLPFDAWRILRALWRNRVWIMFAAVASFTIGFGFGLWSFKNRYIATTTLIRQETVNTFQSSETGEAFKPKQLTAATLVSIMHSSALLKQVGGEASPPISPTLLGLKLTVTPERNTDVIRVDYEGSSSAATTANVLNIYASDVVQMTRDFQSQEATQVNRLLKEQLSAVDHQLGESSQSILNFSKDAQIVSADKETDAYLRQLGDLSLKYESTRIEFETLDLKIASLRAELARHNPMAAKLQQARDDLNNLLVRYTDANPSVIEQKARVESMEKDMLAEKPASDGDQFSGGTAATSLYLEIVDLAAHKETLSKQLEQFGKVRDSVQAKLSALPEKEVELTRLHARRQSLETAHALLASRQREAQIFEENPPGYYRVLSTAAAPDVTTKGRWPKVMLISIVLGVLGSLGTMLIVAAREAFDSRIESAHDFARVTRLPIVLEFPPLTTPAAELETWSFRTWTSLTRRLQPSPNGTIILGVAAGRAGKEGASLIHQLAAAAAQRGHTVIAIAGGASHAGDASEAAAPLPLSKALAEPRLPVAVAENPANLHPIAIDSDWSWTRERRTQFAQALAIWQYQRSPVVLIELPSAADPETLLLAESLPNLIWLGGGGVETSTVREQLDTFRAVRCHLVGAAFPQSTATGSPAWLSKWLTVAVALALVGGSLSAGEPSGPTKVALSSKGAPQMAAWQERLTLGPGDTVNITLFGSPDTARTELPVGPDGKISFLEAQDITAGGQTIDELRAALDTELSKYYRNARTIVTPGILRSKKYYILGKVVDKGAFTLERPLTIVEAVARARGLETGLFQQNTVELADLPRSFMIRHGERMKVDFEKLFQQGDLSQNIPLEPEDYLYFPSSNTNEVYVLGAVQAPGIQGFTPNATVVSMATIRGGFLPKAYLDRVLIVRGSLTHPQTFVVNVSKILKAKEPDFRLQPKDLMYVAEKPWARAEEIVDIAVRTFVQAAAAGWASENIGPFITAPIFPSIK